MLRKTATTTLLTATILATGAGIAAANPQHPVPTDHVTSHSVLTVYCTGSHHKDISRYYRTTNGAAQAYSNTVQRLDGGAPIYVVVLSDYSQRRPVLADVVGTCATPTVAP